MGKKGSLNMIKVRNTENIMNVCNDFVAICKLTQSELKSELFRILKKKYKKDDVINGNGFLYARGNDVLLTAHMDTTPNVGGKKRKRVQNVLVECHKKGKGKESHVLSSPQGIGGDDRCGIYMILRILNDTEFRPSILFCEDEEIGCIGSSKFAETEYISEISNLKFLIELDRRGNDDLVFYDDENEDFHIWCEKVTGYKESYGSCSDISNLMPESKRSGVNLSCGYYDEHTLEETVVLEEMLNTLKATKKLVEASKTLSEPFEFVEYVQKFKNWYGNGYYNWGYDLIEVTIVWNESGETRKAVYEGETEYECLASFFTEHIFVCFADIEEYYVS